MFLQLLVAAAVVLLPLPSLALGVRNVSRIPGFAPGDPGDRTSVVVIVSLRVVALLLVFLLSAVCLVSAIGSLIKGIELHGLVYVFCILDLLLALLIVLSFGRRELRREHRSARPARR